MHLTTLLTCFVSGGIYYSTPDQLDILRGSDRTPQLKILMDMSGSMLSGYAQSPCEWYLGELGRAPDETLNRIEQVVAVLTGCLSDGDGIIDRWSSQIVFSIDGYHGFPSQGLKFPQIHPFPKAGVHFQSDGAELERAIRGLPHQIDPEAGTPLAEGYRRATQDFNNVFDNSNTRSCRGNTIVVMTDGVGNSGVTSHFSWISGVGGQEVRDDSACFCAADPDRSNPNVACPACGEDFRPPHLHNGARYVFGDVATGLHDALQKVDGVQPLRTHTISFNAPSASRALLEEMAVLGGGEHFEADNYEQLSSAFNSAIYRVNSNADASFQGISVQTTGIFTGNYIYQNLVQGSGQNGYWFGNIKKYCLFPELPNDNCFLRAGSSADEWILNENPSDLWSSSRSKQTREGGAGQKILSALAGRVVDTPPKEVAQNPPLGRNIVTWEQTEHTYKKITDFSFTQKDSFSLNAFYHNSLINQLYGYAFDAVSSENGAPTRFEPWPLADTINGGQILLKYSAECESASDRCYFISVSNAGMLHVFNAYSGKEIVAVIPSHFWRPNGVANSRLIDILDQPTPDYTRRFYFDGGVSLYHRDENGNGYIDEREDAELIAGFGRGGAAYIKWDVSELAQHGGALDKAGSPPFPLVQDQESGFKHLRDTWAAPWLGVMQVKKGNDVEDQRVAIFPSGHMTALDAPSAAFAEFVEEDFLPANDREEAGHYISLSCADFGVPVEQCRFVSMQTICSVLGIESCSQGSRCTPCNAMEITECGGTPCYDWPGLSFYEADDLTKYGISQLYPLLASIGPFSWSSGPSSGIAFRVHFSRVSLQPDDQLDIVDSIGSVVQSIEGPYNGRITSEWIYSPGWSLRIKGNGADDAEAYGYEIDYIDVMRDVVAAPVYKVRPSVYIVSLDEWNGKDAWKAIPEKDDSSQADGILVRFVSDCSGVQHGVDEVCIDAFYSDQTRDLKYMRCPLSAAPSVFSEGNILRGIYIPDECGQIWSITQNRERTTWAVKRLLSTNRVGADGAVVGGGESRNYRKIFTKLDIVLSTCTGGRAIGVYFGTGNIQRPAAIPGGNYSPGGVQLNLQDPAITSFSNVSTNRDVIGVVWDSPDTPQGGYTLEELINVGSVVKIDPRVSSGHAGMFIELAEEEKSLRPPLVFLGVANFQTYQPITAVGECKDAVGRSYLYQFDNCTAEPAMVNAQAPSDRKRLLNDKSLIGGGLLVVTDNDKKPVILAGDAKSGGVVSISQLVDDSRMNRGQRLYCWRTDVD